MFGVLNACAMFLPLLCVAGMSGSLFCTLCEVVRLLVVLKEKKPERQVFVIYLHGTQYLVFCLSREEHICCGLPFLFVAILERNSRANS